MRLAPFLLTLLVLSVVAAAPAAAQSREGVIHPNRGVYLALGGGAGMQFPAPVGGASGYPESAFGFMGELRAGFSLSRTFQIFLSVDSGGSSQPAGFLQATNVLGALRYFLWFDEDLGVYVRGGIGIGFVSYSEWIKDAGKPTTGLSEAGGLGMEIRLDKGWSLSPEVFYRRTNDSSIFSADMIGLALLVNFN